MGDIASAPALAKLATPFGLRAPLFDWNKSDFSVHRKVAVADTVSVQNLVHILECAAEFLKEEPLYIQQELLDIQEHWNLFQQLLAVATRELQPLHVDTLVPQHVECGLNFTTTCCGTYVPR